MRSPYDKIIRSLWHPAATRRLARALADLAADTLLLQQGAVRPSDSAQRARRIVNAPSSPGSATKLAQRIQRSSLKLAHPRYLAQQVAAPIPLAALVESLVAALNQSLAVWEMAPAATAIDRSLFIRFKRLFGLPRQAEGTLVPGGAFGNLTALFAAREALAPRSRGAAAPALALIAGEQAHYSVKRAAAVLGLRPDAVFRVPLDREFCTDIERVPEAIAAARHAGFRQLVLIGSAGSTATGSFDDLAALRRLASREGAWLHVDAAHGGGMAFSRRLRRRLRGIDSADSIVFDPHKMMFMPLTAGGVLLRDGWRLRAPLAEQAPYLFGAKRAWPDIGQYSIACSQRFDALKIWLVWQVYGSKVWDALVTQTCAVCDAGYRYCRSSRWLEPVHAPHSNIMCFRLRGIARRDADRVHWQIKEEINESGYAYLSSTVLSGRRVLRLVIMNPRTRAADVIDVLRRVERAARAWARPRASRARR
ncbi:MAG: aspartate aminotransferase family protein [Gammaproteobacteria bacterium]|nr:aspartate aminotransferase family protein [Gammaproteobacteria bacterium]